MKITGRHSQQCVHNSVCSPLDKVWGIHRWESMEGPTRGEHSMCGPVCDLSYECLGNSRLEAYANTRRKRMLNLFCLHFHLQSRFSLAVDRIQNPHVHSVTHDHLEMSVTKWTDRFSVLLHYMSVSGRNEHLIYNPVVYIYFFVAAVGPLTCASPYSPLDLPAPSPSSWN